jgi:hypothetical protein
MDGEHLGGLKMISPSIKQTIFNKLLMSQVVLPIFKHQKWTIQS